MKAKPAGSKNPTQKQATAVATTTTSTPPPRGLLPQPAPDDDELDEKLADAEQVQQLADWVSNRKDELQEKFDNMSEAVQEGGRGQAVQEQIEALDSAESSIGDEMTDDDLLHVIDELEMAGFKVPHRKVNPPKRAVLTLPVCEVMKPLEPKNDAERADRDRFFLLDRGITEWASNSLKRCADLDEIYTRGLWKWGGYTNYPHYIKVKFRYAESTAYQYKEAGRVYNVLKDSTTVESLTLPKSERQLRPLLDIKDNSKIVEVWKKANELYSQTGNGVTEKAVASAKRMVLHRRRAKPPTITADQLADQFVKQFRPKWDRCLEGEHGELLANLLVVLKVFYEELNMDERSPRLTAIFKDIDIVESEPPVKAKVEVNRAAKPEPDKGKPAKRSTGHHGFDWDQLNWELRNPDLADAWHKKAQTVRQMRCRFQYRAAVKCDPEQYQRKLAKEEEKAKAFGQSQPVNGTPPTE